MAFTGIYISLCRCIERAIYPFLTWIYTEDRVAPKAMTSTEHLPTLPSTRPSNMEALLSALEHRGTRAVCNKGSIQSELWFLKTTFSENGCSVEQIRQALNPTVRTSKPKVKPTSVVLVSYVQTTHCRPAGRLSRMLANTTLNMLPCCLGNSAVSFVL